MIRNETLTPSLPQAADKPGMDDADFQRMLDSTTTPRTWVRNLIASLASIVIAIIILTNVNDIKAQGGGLSALNGRFWPTVLAVALVVIALGIVLVPLVSRGGRDYHPDAVTASGVGKLVVGMALLVGFVMTWGTIQFGVAAVAVAAVMTFIFGGRNLSSLVLFPVTLGLIFHFLFIVALKVPVQ